MTEHRKTLTRIPAQGQIAGVCAGLAEYFDVDVTLVRVIFVVLALASGGAFVVGYIILAIVMPVADVAPGKSGSRATGSVNLDSETISENVERLGEELRTNERAARLLNYVGIGLVILGVWLLLAQFYPGWINFRWDYIWPIILIFVGLFIVTRKKE